MPLGRHATALDRQPGDRSPPLDSRSSKKAPRSIATSSVPVLRAPVSVTNVQTPSLQVNNPPSTRASESASPIVASASPTATAMTSARPNSGCESNRATAHAAIAAIAAPATSQTATRQTSKRRSLSSKNTLSRMACAGASAQARLKTRVPLVPPNPKLFLTACSIFIGRASLAQ